MSAMHSRVRSPSMALRTECSHMSTNLRPSIGILRMERGSSYGTGSAPPAPGSLGREDTFGLPVIFETAEGAWGEDVSRGDPSLEGCYVAAARRLEARGAVAISSNCGFTIRYQKAVAAAVSVPVGMSSLLLLPTLLRLVNATKGRHSHVRFSGLHRRLDRNFLPPTSARGSSFVELKVASFGATRRCILLRSSMTQPNLHHLPLLR